MARDDDFRDFILDQLADLPDVSARRMFGAAGLYAGETFFGIVAGGTLYLKVDDETRPRYEAAGMGPFHATARQTLTSYYEVPAEVLEDAEDLAAWARDAVAAQRRRGR